MVFAFVTRTISSIPVPLFANVGTAFKYGMKKAKSAPRYAPWAIPGLIGGAWFIWPAVSDESKIFLGILPDPEAVAVQDKLKEKMTEAIELDMDKVLNASKKGH